MNPAPSNSNNWFVCPQPNSNAEIRLFFFPYAGGGPTVFNKWSTEFPSNMETWIAHYPGRGSRYNEPPIKELITLVEKINEAIQPLLDKPFIFFGHSLGGMVAFELIRHLRQRKLPQPNILFVSACGAPHIPDPHPPIHTLSDAEFIKSLQELNGIPAEVVNHSELMKMLLPALRADFEAIESYQYISNEHPLTCPIIAFGGNDDPCVSRERLEGWALHTNASFKSQYFPGDHFFINMNKDAIIAEIKSSHDKDNWTLPPDALDLKFHQVDVWRVSLDLQADSVKWIESSLSTDESERAARFHFPADKDRFIIAHACLRDILARYLNLQPSDLTFSVNRYGKPALNNHKLEFNLSHSGDFALVAVTLERKVGVDIERIRSDMGLESIASRYFSQSEVSELSALTSEQRFAGFFNCWTRKEAYIKAHGLGLSLPLESFDVSLTPNEPAILRATRPDPQEAARWMLLSLDVAPNYASAVAIAGKDIEFQMWDCSI